MIIELLEDFLKDIAIRVPIQAINPTTANTLMVFQVIASLNIKEIIITIIKTINNGIIIKIAEIINNMIIRIIINKEMMMITIKMKAFKKEEGIIKVILMVIKIISIRIISIETLKITIMTNMIENTKDITIIIKTRIQNSLIKFKRMMIIIIGAIIKEIMTTRTSIIKSNRIIIIIEISKTINNNNIPIIITIMVAIRNKGMVEGIIIHIITNIIIIRRETSKKTSLIIKINPKIIKIMMDNNTRDSNIETIMASKRGNIIRKTGVIKEMDIKSRNIMKRRIPKIKILIKIMRVRIHERE